MEREAFDVLLVPQGDAWAALAVPASGYGPAQFIARGSPIGGNGRSDLARAIISWLTAPPIDAPEEEWEGWAHDLEAVQILFEALCDLMAQVDPALVEHGVPTTAGTVRMAFYIPYRALRRCLEHRPVVPQGVS